VQHSAKHTGDDLRRTVPLVQRLCAAGPAAPLPARLDSGFDSAALMACIESLKQPGLPRADWIIKWNPRAADPARLAAEHDAAGAAWERPRKGKRVATWGRTVGAVAFSARCPVCCGWSSARSARAASN
jgi:hypothetical protein